MSLDPVELTTLTITIPKFLETESRMKTTEMLPNWCRASAWEDERVQEMVGADGGTEVQTHGCPGSTHLKMLK